MSVQLIRAAAALFKRAEQAAMGFATRDAEIPIIARATEGNGEVASVAGITPLEVDGDPIVVAAHDPEFTRAQVQAQTAPGGEVHRERVVLKVFDLKFGVRQTLGY